MAHQLPPLPYAYDALEPYLDARTLEIADIIAYVMSLSSGQ